MNEVIKTIKERRSIRAYKNEQITDAQLDAILEAGAYAASGMGKQATVIVPVQDPEIIAMMSGLNAKVMGMDIDPFYGAPTVVVVFADADETATPVEDGSLVIGNMMLAASTLNVGSCWIHRAQQEFDSPEGKALLKQWGIPTHYRGVGHCILGYPASELPAPKPRKEDYIVRV
jgi:nitroreductase